MPRHALPDSAYPTAIDITAARHRRRAAASPRRRRARLEAAPVTPIIPAPRRAADDDIAHSAFDAQVEQGVVSTYVDSKLYTHDDEPVIDELFVGELVIATPPAQTPPAPTRAAGRNRHRLPPASRRTGLRMPRGKRKQATAVLVATAAGIIGVPSAGAAATSSVDPCRWIRAAHELVVALDEGDDSQQAQQLRKALDKAGVGPDLPEKCNIDTTQYLTPVDGNADERTSDEDADADADAGAEQETPEAVPAPSSPKHAKPDTEEAPATAAAPKPAPPKPALEAAGGTTAGAGTTAAEKLGWGTPVKHDDFTSGLDGWNIYDGPGHAGNGRRTPDAASAANGMLTIAGDPSGNTAGMAWGEGQKYGRWEGRVKAPASDESYNALLLLWPDAENFPVGGEIDFMEMMDHTRQTTNMFLHHGANNDQVDGEVNIDATQWHNWAVEWTPDHVAAFVDGKEWFRTTDKSILPPGPMHLCIQLDYFPEGGDVQHSQMQVDWIKQYAI